MARFNAFYINNQTLIKFYTVVVYDKINSLVENNSSLILINNDEKYDSSLDSINVINSSSLVMKNIGSNLTNVSVRNKSMAKGTNNSTTSKDQSSL